jgi:hypothetical protein
MLYNEVRPESVIFSSCDVRSVLSPVADEDSRHTSEWLHLLLRFSLLIERILLPCANFPEKKAWTAALCLVGFVRIVEAWIRAADGTLSLPVEPIRFSLMKNQVPPPIYRYSQYLYL